MLGRRYDIFHNQVLMGQLEVSAYVPYGPSERSVHASVRLMRSRLLNMEVLTRFLHDIASHVEDKAPLSLGGLKAQQAIDHAMLKVVWKHQQISRWKDMPESWGDLELDLYGPASFYFVRRDAPARKSELRATG